MCQRVYSQSVWYWIFYICTLGQEKLSPREQNMAIVRNGNITWKQEMSSDTDNTLKVQRGVLTSRSSQTFLLAWNPSCCAPEVKKRSGTAVSASARWQISGSLRTKWFTQTLWHLSARGVLNSLDALPAVRMVWPPEIWLFKPDFTWEKTFTSMQKVAVHWWRPGEALFSKDFELLLLTLRQLL